MKKMRSLLRLIKDDVPATTYDPAWDAATTLKDVFGRARDAAVQQKVKTGVTGKKTSSKKASRLTPQEHSIAQAAANALVKNVRAIDMTSIPAKTLLTGLDHTFISSAHAMHKAHETPEETDSFHNWRKRVKDLWYQSAVLAKIHPHAIIWGKTARKLSACLGNEHDLGLLAEREKDSALHATLAVKLHAVRSKAFEIGEALHPPLS